MQGQSRGEGKNKDRDPEPSHTSGLAEAKPKTETDGELPGGGTRDRGQRSTVSWRSREEYSSGRRERTVELNTVERSPKMSTGKGPWGLAT